MIKRSTVKLSIIKRSIDKQSNITSDPGTLYQDFE